MSYNTFYGPDISTYQTVTDWGALNNGAAFIMIKSSGSDAGSYIDDKYFSNIANARHFGNALPRIVYHFGGGNDDGSDPVNEANYFVDNIGVTLQVGEAYEIDCERGVAVQPDWAKKFLDQCRSRLGWGGGVYVSQARLVSEDWSPVANAGYFVHPANWGVPPSGNFSVGAFNTYSFQQYTDHATWPGISAPCDGDCFFGNAAIDILKFGKPAPVTPVPIPSLPPQPVIQPSSTPPVEPTQITPQPTPTPAPVVPPAPTTTPTVNQPTQQKAVSQNNSQGGDMNKVKSMWSRIPDPVKRVFHTFWQAAGGALVAALLTARSTADVKLAVMGAVAVGLAAVKGMLLSK